MLMMTAANDMFRACVALLVASIFVTFGDAIAAGRSVAVVYDDSGSMRGEQRWLYANFALQTLIGLMEPNDELYLVTMSAPTIAQSMHDREAKMGAISKLKRAVEPVAQTPYMAIQTAMNALRESKGQPEQRWLVVITDGGFEELRKNSRVDQDTVAEEFSDFVRTTGARSILLLIGDKADRFLGELWRRKGQATVLEAANSRQIVDRMHEVASMLASRAGGVADLGRSGQGNEVVLSPRFPLWRLIVFAQTDGKRKLPRPLGVSAAGVDLDKDDVFAEMVKPAVGGRSAAAIVKVVPRKPATLIPEGKDRLRISFDSSEGLSDVRFYPEVAARLDVELKNAGGTRILANAKGILEPCAGDMVQVVSRLMVDDKRTLTETQTDTTQFKTTFILADGPESPMAINASKTEFVGSFPAEPGTRTLSAAASFPGYFNFRSRIFTLTSRDCRPRNISLAVDTAGWKGSLPDLDRASVKLSGLADGQPIDKGEFASWNVALPGGTSVDFHLEKNTQSIAWILHPKLKWGCVCFTATGLQAVKVTLTGARPGETGEVVVPLTIEEMPWWRKCGPLVIAVIAVVFFIWWIVGIWTKPRFRQGAIIDYKRGGRIQHKELAGSWFGRFVVPYRAERRRVENLVFKAGTGTHILLPREVQATGMFIEGRSLEAPGEKDERIEDGDTLQVAARTPETYKYSYR